MGGAAGALARAALVGVIEPGRAFGTGGHGSTRSCLELLERALAGGRVAHALDVGCGSGILAIAAAALGVPRVDAIDVDPDAVAATEDNARRNGVATACARRWRTSTAGPARRRRSSSRISSRPRTSRSRPRSAGCSRPGGSLIAGGLLAHEVPAVTGVFAAEGCWLVELAEDDGWAALLLRRGG